MVGDDAVVLIEPPDLAKALVALKRAGIEAEPEISLGR
jgi:hypothetical protein